MAKDFQRILVPKDFFLHYPLVHMKEKGNIPEDFIPTARFYGKISKSSDLLETFLAGKLLRSAASLASARCRFSLSDETVSLPASSREKKQRVPVLEAPTQQRSHPPHRRPSEIFLLTSQAATSYVVQVYRWASPIFQVLSSPS